MSDQPPSKGSDNLDDIFHPLDSNDVPPISTAPTSGEVPPPPPGYVPPPPTSQPRRPPPILYILIGAALAVVCLCGVCFAIFGLGASGLVGNPTFKAILVTAQVEVGTAVYQFDLPPKLPKNNKSAGSIAAGDTQMGQLIGTRPDVWQYEGSSGQTLTINVTAQQNGLVPMIGLYDSDGKLLEKTPFLNTGRSQSLSYLLPANGTYNILVGSLTSGSYEIKVSNGNQ